MATLWEVYDILPFLTVICGFRPNSQRLILGRLKIFKNYLLENNLELTNENIERFLTFKKESTGNNNTTNSYICAINQLIKYYIHKEIRNDLKTIPSLKKTRPPIEVLSPQEIKDILSVDLKYGHFQKNTDPSIELNNVYRRATLFLSLTACRFQEMATLRLKDLDVENGWVTFRETKNGDWRRVGILEPLLTELREQVVKKEPEDLVFCNLNGNRLQETTFCDTLKEKARLCGIKKRVYPHVFRHSFITQMIQQGVDITSVAQIAGHKDIKSTAYYTHLDGDYLKKEMMTHPLIREKTAPENIIKMIIQTISQFKLSEDKRFSYQITDEGDSLSINLKVVR